MRRHVMVDLETLGLKPGCPIVSIGAVCFINAPINKNTNFYITILPKSRANIMDRPDESTLKWWEEQSVEARAEVFDNPISVDILDALPKFKQFLQQLQVYSEDEIVIWGNGASFDEPILAEAFKRAGIALQWSFRNSMCFRTLKELAKMYGIELPEFEGVKHNALADAVYQAKCANTVFNFLDHAVEDATK